MLNDNRMIIKHRRIIYKIGVIVLLLVFFMLAGCAPPAAERPDWSKFEMFWPMPPAEPRIKFVDILQDKADVGGGSDGSYAKQLFGEDGSSAEQLRKPFAVAADKEGKVYVGEAGRVVVFDKKNNKLSFIGEAGAGKLSSPLGIAIHDNRVFISDSGSKKIVIYDVQGKFLRAIGGKDEFENPVGVAIDKKRLILYVADSKKHIIKAYNLDGTFIREFGGGQIFFPIGVATDKEGNVYVSDSGFFRIAIFDPDGNFKGSFGKIGDRPGSFTRPKGIAIDSEDHIYVVDAAFQNFQIFNKEGQILMFVGGAGAAPGQFSLPAGIYIDENDTIYVADQLNRRVQIFQYLGDKWKQSQGIQPNKK